MSLVSSTGSGMISSTGFVFLFEARVASSTSPRFLDVPSMFECESAVAVCKSADLCGALRDPGREVSAGSGID